LPNLRTWRVEAVASFPIDFVFADASGNLLEKAETRSRVPEGESTFADHRVIVRKTEIPGLPAVGGRELAAFTFQTSAANSQGAIDAATPVIEDLAETFAFQMQQLVPIVQVSFLDVTPPVEVGEQREGILFPYPNGLPLPKFQSSVALGDVITSLVPVVAPLEPDNARAEAALGWHLKAMASPFVAEQFMLNWIALEILWRRSGVSVQAPYKANCGHVIEECPTCGKPTSREVRGASIEKYLVEVCGVGSEEAKRLWRLRQMFHGDVAFDSAEAAALPEFIQILRAAVVKECKASLGVSAEALPLVSSGAASFGPQMALGTLQEVKEHDLA
jgi:hypothetical protein